LQEAYQSVEERSEKLEMFMFSILFSFRNYIRKPNVIPNYSKKANDDFEDFELEKDSRVVTVEPELELIRIEITKTQRFSYNYTNSGLNSKLIKHKISSKWKKS